LARASAFLLQIEENSSQRPLSNQWAEALSLLKKELGASVRCRSDINGMRAFGLPRSSILGHAMFPAAESLVLGPKPI